MEALLLSCSTWTRSGGPSSVLISPFRWSQERGKIRLGKREEMKDEWVSWGAPSNPVLMRAGVHFISKFPLPLAVIKLSYTFFLVFRWQPENTNRIRRHSAGVLWTQECSWTDIWFGFEGNRSELQGAKRRGERIWKVELWFTDYWAFSSPEQL